MKFLKKNKKIFNICAIFLFPVFLSSCYMGFAPKPDTCTESSKDLTVKQCPVETKK